jgi:predicted DNA repair protein MutK
VAAAPFWSQVTVLTGIAILMTVGVYGLVAGIVKLDDAGLYLSKADDDGAWSRLRRGVGRAILAAAPYLMKSLSIAGTAAMFLVGGGILVHGIPRRRGACTRARRARGRLPVIGGLSKVLAPMLLNAAGRHCGGRNRLGRHDRCHADVSNGESGCLSIHEPEAQRISTGKRRRNLDEPNDECG